LVTAPDQLGLDLQSRDNRRRFSLVAPSHRVVILQLPVTLPGALFRTTAHPPPGLSDIGRDTLADAGVIRDDARITITRESADDVGFREVFLSIDGESVAVLRHGERFTTEVVSGLHRLRAHNTLFWKTHDLILRPGEHARFTVVNRAGWGTFGMLFFLGAMPVYLTFERLTQPIAPVQPRSDRVP
jgi:hypothetical protein